MADIGIHNATHSVRTGIVALPRWLSDGLSTQLYNESCAGVRTRGCSARANKASPQGRCCRRYAGPRLRPRDVVRGVRGTILAVAHFTAHRQSTAFQLQPHA
eukprot:6214127-Pleurochrysis_carterae.AAC.2